MSLTTDNSYSTITEADAFWSDRNDSTWAAASEEEKTAALIRATEWIDTGFSWPGTVKETDQVLSWPRVKAYDDEGRLREGIPSELKNATAWIAREALEAELDPAQQRGGDISSVKAGSVEVEWNSSAPTGKSYRYVSRMLRNITVGGPNQIKLVRS